MKTAKFFTPLTPEEKKKVKEEVGKHFWDCFYPQSEADEISKRVNQKIVLEQYESKDDCSYIL